MIQNTHAHNQHITHDTCIIGFCMSIRIHEDQYISCVCNVYICKTSTLK